MRGLVLAILIGIASGALIAYRIPGAWVEVLLFGTFSITLAFVWHKLSYKAEVESDVSQFSQEVRDMSVALNELRIEARGLMDDVALSRAVLKSAVEVEIVPQIKETLEATASDIRKEVESSLEGLNHTVHRNSLSIVWKHMPFNNGSEEWTEKEKARFFDAMQSGDWRKVVASRRKRL